jgi:hypothetical protein
LQPELLGLSETYKTIFGFTLLSAGLTSASFTSMSILFFGRFSEGFDLGLLMANALVFGFFVFL